MTASENRVDQLFTIRRNEGRKSLIIFLTGGFPSLSLTPELVWTLEDAGADLIELGVPFSDPIADGPTIQASSGEALKNGASLEKLLECVRRIRTRSDVPLILFSAYNPFFRYGIGKIAPDAKAAGADGFLAADLPPEEGEEFRSLCAKERMSLVFLAAPTSSPERLRVIAKSSTGFIYYMAVKGVTGARDALPKDARLHIQEIKSVTDKPVAIGFGISTPEHVKRLSRDADAVVVGSALIRLIQQHAGSKDLLKKVKTYVSSLAAPLR